MGLTGVEIKVSTTATSGSKTLMPPYKKIVFPYILIYIASNTVHIEINFM
jgi:hypothetical protein